MGFSGRLVRHRLQLLAAVVGAAQPETRLTSRTEAARSRPPFPGVKAVVFRVLSAQPTTFVLLFLGMCVCVFYHLLLFSVPQWNQSEPACGGGTPGQILIYDLQHK